MKLTLVVAILALAQCAVADDSDVNKAKQSGQNKLENKTQSNESAASSEKILRTNAALKSYQESYVDSPGNKAFAQSPDGHWNWRSDRVSPEMAQEDALASCNKHVRKDERPCVIVNMNGEWIKPQQ